MNLDEQLKRELRGLCPSAEIEFWSQGRLKFHWNMGRPYKYYDLASLTKILFTVLAFMDLKSQKRIRLEDPVIKFLPWFPKPKVTIKQLLSHQSGLHWWLPVYEDIDSKTSDAWWQVKRAIRSAPFSKEKKATYSDLGFWTLGLILEETHQRPLIQVWNEIQLKYHQRSGLHFRPLGQKLGSLGDYAPTEFSERLVKRLRGEVHDDNCHALGGVCSHAGLFGSVRDVSRHGLWLLDQWNSGNKELRQFTTAQGFDWGLGYMMPSSSGASCGELFSKKSFGHLGFTGCSLWVDPVNQWVMSIVSNRVYHGRLPEFAKKRGLIHDLVVSHRAL